METVHILTAGLTAIILFVFGLDNFSREIQSITGERFRKSLAKATQIPLAGVFIGAIVTAIIQSSSATSVIAISLVNAGILSFKNSVGIIFGSNIGTTITAQLVAFKLTAFAPLFIILGFFLSLLKSRHSVFGKAIFYFGFVFFSLNLISSTLQPLQNNAQLVRLLTEPHNPIYSIIFGCLFTAIIQSSSVTTGLAIIFTQQGILGLENAVPLIMGANIGTTGTALIAMFNMDASAKKAAFSHFLFNFGGVLVFIPALFFFQDKLSDIQMDPAIALANIHFVFNVTTSVLFLIFIGPFTRLVNSLLGEGKMDFERIEIPKLEEDESFETVKSKLRKESNRLLNFLQENYNLVTLSIESNYNSVFTAAEKRIEYFEYIKREYIAYFSKIITKTNDDNEPRALIGLINQFDYLFQIHDSIQDIYNTKKVMSKHFVELRSDMLLMVRELSSETLVLFDELKRGLETEEGPKIKELAWEMQEALDDAHQRLLALLSDQQRKDVGPLVNFITYSQRLKDKLINYAKIAANPSPAAHPATSSEPPVDGDEEPKLNGHTE